jgi:putative acetyltransferase
MVVRPEDPRDRAAIHAVNRAAFETDAEARLADAFRKSGALISSLVAVEGNQIVGHIFFSLAWIEGKSRACRSSLAPTAVLPALQGRGFGTALVRAGFYDAPNRFGLPAFYELRVWAWRGNPNGAFVDWNQRVSCEGR